MEGYVHLYTGNGKGKTTAAFGLALRALCAGKSVYVGQFVKSMKYNETAAEKVFGALEVEQFGSGCFIDRNPDGEDVRLARADLEKCAALMKEGRYDVVILDEICIAVHFGLVSDNEVVAAISGRAPGVEVVMTGRYATQALADCADLVTDMREIKHYYTKGVLSRNGIDR